MTMSLSEQIAIHEARMRLKKEPSSALPAHRYLDPAKTFEYESELERRRKAKQKKRQERGK